MYRSFKVTRSPLTRSPFSPCDCGNVGKHERGRGYDRHVSKGMDEAPPARTQIHSVRCKMTTDELI